MAEKKIVLTYEGLDKLEKELQELKTIRRKEVAEKIKEARGQGDLSENAEYDAAKEEQAEIETRIVEIEKILRNAHVIDEDDVNVDVINLGCRVKIQDMEFDEVLDYAIVGSTEADPSEGKISNESPVGAALIGHKVGDVVEVEVPEGKLEFKILEIYR
ncbi:MAG: transcription elongation factor GreA [Epulopiscium sp.]|jgi:transcription elongation factor GreA|uniref:Transcription elongation factor GreA n=1 Tax=Defluviitalea raffinosedens TaxID=1450156 RepID=A0A7C8LLU5_9FIRM|nr:transcription elongation factor GreA [Defluviitalea raffinosedens]MBZ4668340.1 greA [Defluviitaleaceae bacterium]MDK2787384.1 transcription elongation factor GreA [Candidatus Epulonipiscium sp.]KAE9636219.1 transcription elongation factor GreA [Defluviitalea raffinosedens]MBM7684921.1 transcription elongation factor GreA [Defluviitalea raffinosedens]HHW66198.1 transcription elongation factor GreA [Candidatus Epulonipiscium sp.]